MPNTLINVSNRLPVTVEEDRVTKSSGGLVAALEGLPEGQYTTKWIGWSGSAFPEESRRQEIAQKLDQEYGCVAVFLSQEEAAGFYDGFSNSLLLFGLTTAFLFAMTQICGVGRRRWFILRFKRNLGDATDS
jgi:trehalose-6-phosphate synthase